MTQQQNSEAGKRLAEISLALLSDRGGIHPYKAKFWKAYLGEAYALWELVRLRSSRTSGWSSVQTYAMGELAAALNISRMELGSYLDRLHEAKVMVAEIAETDTEGYVIKVRVQAWHDLPILTPHQAGQLSPELQAEHRAWLEENLQRLGEGGLN